VVVVIDFMNMKTNLNLAQICLLAMALWQTPITQAQPIVTRIAAGQEFSVLLKSDGSLWTMGDNQFGELGTGPGISRTNRPQQIVSNNVTTIAAGGYFCLYVKSDGSLWGMGDNEGNQLGNNISTETNLPERIVLGTAPSVSAIAGAFDYSLFLDSQGTLWGTGDNAYGNFGNGTNHNTTIPEQLPTASVKAIAVGYISYTEHTLYLKSDGSLWATGDNEHGQLGDGTYNETNRAEQIEPANVTAIAAGGEFSLFLMNNGSLWAMGRNDSGQLGDNTTNLTANTPEIIVSNGVTAISAGLQHSLFIKSDGSLWAMGNNQYGQLGDGTYNASTNVPEMIVSNGVTVISAGGAHSLFLKSDGSLWGMGFNVYGQLGDGTANVSTNRPEQILAGSSVPPGYDQISGQFLSGGSVRLSFIGLAGTNYALDRSFSLTPALWVAQLTNTAGAGGVLIFTNAPALATNNFWRIHSVP